MIRVFCAGETRAKTVALLGHRRERAVGHALDLVAPDDAGTVEADLTAHVLGDQLVVAGEDLHHDAVAAERAECLGDALHRRIEEGHEAGEHELTLVTGRIYGLGRHHRVGDGQDPRSLTAQLAVRRFAARPRRLIEGSPAIVDLVRRAAGEDALGGPLRDQQALAAALDDDGETPPLEVERDLVDLPVLVANDPAALENRRVQRTLDARLMGAIDTGQGQRPLRDLAKRVEGPIKHHVTAREGARLVAAEDVHAAEVLDRLEVLDDHLLARHVGGAAGEGDGADHGQEFGGQAHRQCHREEQRLEKRVMQQRTAEQDEQHEEEHRARDEERELPSAALELGLGRPRRQARGNVAERGRRPRRDDQRRRRPAHDRRAKKDDVAGIRRLMRRGLEVDGVLLSRHRLARQGRLLDVEVSRLEEARVGRHTISRHQPDDVTGNQVAPPDFAPGSIAESSCRRRDDVAQSFRDAVGAVRLNEVEHHTQDHHEDNDGGVDPLPEDRGGGTGDQQGDDQRICQEQEDLNETGRPWRARRLVRADLAEPPARVGGRQASA